MNTEPTTTIENDQMAPPSAVATRVSLVDTSSAPLETVDFPLTRQFSKENWRAFVFKDADSSKLALNSIFMLRVTAVLYLMVYGYFMVTTGILSTQIPLTGVLLLILLFALFAGHRAHMLISSSGVKKYMKSKRSLPKLPLPVIPKLKFNLTSIEHPWSDLRSIRFVEKKQLPLIGGSVILDRSDSVVFDWNSSSQLANLSQSSTDYVSLGLLTAEERAQLFLLISRFVPQELLSPEVLFLQVQTLHGTEEARLSDYTTVWLEEFNKRFEISNYVTLPPGAVCGNGRFVITMTIATRINTSTYLAVDKSGNKVVIKELVAPIDSNGAAQKKQLEQFNREASILATLRHHSIIKIRDHFIDNGRSYIVMDCAEGMNMRQRVRTKGNFSELEAVSIAQQLIEMLQYLHQHNPPILHRDLTPDNLVYVERTKTVTVIDFGAANIFTTGKTVTLVGKQFYMPPEQFRGQPTPASDIYALGATLCFLVSGKDLASMAKLPPLDDVQISQDLLKLIEDCTRFEVTQRPSADQVRMRLESMAPTQLSDTRTSRTV